MYNLQANDGTVLEFSRDEISHMQVIHTMCSDSNKFSLHESDSDPIVVAIVNGEELRVLKQFLRIRTICGEGPRRKERPPIICDAEIMEKGVKGTGYNMVYWPALIDVEAVPVWNAQTTGISQEYLEFLHQIENSNRTVNLFHWLTIADYVHCNDLIYLIQARCAFILVHFIAQYYCRLVKEMLTDAQKINRFVQWSSVLVPGDNDAEYEFMVVYNEIKSTRRHLTRGILNTFIRHRGMELPRETWVDADWERFKARAPEFYRKLPVPDDDRAKLYVRATPV